MIIIHSTARVSPKADIEDSIKGSKIIINENAIIDSFVKIKPAGGHGDLIIGENSIINSGCVLYTGNGINIGQNVAVAANCTFAPVNHEYRLKNTLIMKQGFRESKGGIIVGNDVWIGANCVILDGVEIGDGSVIAAGSIVRGKLDEYGIYAGFPLVKIGSRS